MASSRRVRINMRHHDDFPFDSEDEFEPYDSRRSSVRRSGSYRSRAEHMANRRASYEREAQNTRLRRTFDDEPEIDPRFVYTHPTSSVADDTEEDVFDFETQDEESCEQAFSYTLNASSQDANDREFDDSYLFAELDLGEVDYEAPRNSPSRAKIAFAAACVLILVGAGVAVAAIFGGDKEELVSEPATVSAMVKADNVLIPGPELMRGDELTNVSPATELTGVYADSYYRADFNGTTLYVPKQFVRTSEEPAFVQWTGYAATGAIIYKRPDFQGDDSLALQVNDELSVLDAFGDTLFVASEDGYEGYIPSSMVMQAREEGPEQQFANASNSSSSSSSTSRPSSGSNSGGSSSGSSSSAGSSSGGASSGGSGSSGDSSGLSSAGATTPDSGGTDAGGGTNQPSTGDDEDISLLPAAAFGSVSIFEPVLAYADEPNRSEGAEGDELADTGVTAVVLADSTQSYLGLFNRGDVVKVKVGDTGEVEDPCTVIINKQEATMPAKLLHAETEPAYETWMGYALDSAVLYSDYQLSAGQQDLELNRELSVIDSIDTVLVVDVEGTVFYIDTTFVGKEPTVDEEAVEEESAVSSSNSSNSSSNRGSYTSGSSSS